MEFDQHKPIYLQIVDAICERILTGQWPEGDRIPSVRECGVSLEVNPNTVARSYDELSTEGIIHNKRGIGYFVSPGAKSVIREKQRSSFISGDLIHLRRPEGGIQENGNPRYLHRGHHLPLPKIHFQGQ